MTKLTILTAAAAMAALLAAPANAAWYAKFDGVDGDFKSAQFSGAHTLYLTAPEDDPSAVALLLPAVQKVREAAPARSRATRSFQSVELRSGRKTYTLYGARVQATGKPNRVKVTYRCKDWRELRSGRTGSDCPQAAYGKDGGKDGKAETTWKVEEGEN